MKRNSAPASRRAKIGFIARLSTAVLLIILAFVTIGLVQVKDSRKDASYCGSCHEDYYSGWVSEGDTHSSLAHKHAEMSISCQTCHDRTMGESLTEIANYMTGNYSTPLAETVLSNDLCLSCHGPAERVKSLTSVIITRAELDFHDEHHGSLPCGYCHNMHRDSVQVCALCHPVQVEAGWVVPPEDFWTAQVSPTPASP